MKLENPDPRVPLVLVDSPDPQAHLDLREMKAPPVMSDLLDQLDLPARADARASQACQEPKVTGVSQDVKVKKVNVDVKEKREALVPLAQLAPPDRSAPEDHQETEVGTALLDFQV